MSAGKGDKPRNCFSKDFKSNFDLILWNKPKSNEENNTNQESLQKINLLDNSNQHDVKHHLS